MCETRKIANNITTSLQRNCKLTECRT